MIREIPDVRHVSEVRVFPVSLDDTTPGWETGQGNDVLVLDTQDLFVVRGVRVVAEEAE